MGAGAYVCGEETALISSCEGLRGDPEEPPALPGPEGLPRAARPSSTTSRPSAAWRGSWRRGRGWFAADRHAAAAPGTKLLSISGDCRRPGVYEVPFGITLREVLELAGGRRRRARCRSAGRAARWSGPDRLRPDDLLRRPGHRRLDHGLRTGRATCSRSSSAFLEFFVDESCGYCTPCRVGQRAAARSGSSAILAGTGEPADLDYLEELGETVKATSRCGLGQTSPNPVLDDAGELPAASTRRWCKTSDRRLPADLRPPRGAGAMPKRSRAAQSRPLSSE